MTHLHGNSPRLGLQPILTGKKQIYNKFTRQNGWDVASSESISLRKQHAGIS